MEEKYRAEIRRNEKEFFDFGKFLPDLRDSIRPMVAGEVMLLLADTGVGKTMILQNLLRAAAPMPSILFEMELPLALVFERFVQMQMNCSSGQVQHEYKTNDVPTWKFYKTLHHVSVCPESGLSVDQIENIIVRSELKIGRRPLVVAIDYVGLLNKQNSKSRYEALSNAAEQIKVMAKRTGTIILLASQIARPDKKDTLAIGLHDAKDSGALENSAGIVIGAWRPEKTRLMLKILKNTSGTSGEEFEAKFDGEKMQITPYQNNR
jgi:replicative DNA helicase